MGNTEILRFRGSAATNCLRSLAKLFTRSKHSYVPVYLQLTDGGGILWYIIV